MTREMPKRSIIRVLLTATMLLPTSAARGARPYTAACPEADRNVLAVQTARARVAQRCDCAHIASAGEYARCAKREANGLALEGRLGQPCRQVVVAFERKSTCGRHTLAVCCRLAANGRSKSAVGDAGRCMRRGGTPCGSCAQA